MYFDVQPYTLNGVQVPFMIQILGFNELLFVQSWNRNATEALREAIEIYLNNPKAFLKRTR